MSDALYGLGGLRFWSEDEIELREAFQQRITDVIKRTLTGANAAWRFTRTEGPILTPADQVNPNYTDDDIFVTNHIAADSTLSLRAETTASSYAVARRLGHKMPFCVYQAGKSFRRELNDGASAKKLRFLEFWQLEFQCIYSEGTHADYRQILIAAIMPEVVRATGRNVRIVPSDRLPSYSESTVDIEVDFNGRWTEIASCSIRTDYADKVRVCEIAFGLDRIATMAATPKNVDTADE